MCGRHDVEDSSLFFFCQRFSTKPPAFPFHIERLSIFCNSILFLEFRANISRRDIMLGLIHVCVVGVASHPKVELQEHRKNFLNMQ